MFRKTVAILLAVLSLTLFAGCRKKGPAEEAGEKVDKMMDDLKGKFK